MSIIVVRFSHTTDIDECASDPCLHGATCVDLVGGVGCTCASGWTGDFCEIGNKQITTGF